MSTTIRYILITAFRDWLFLGLFLVLMIAFGISGFLGDTALVEEAQMSLSYAAGSTRVILLVGLIVFVCFHVRTAFANREIELILSRPISRHVFVISYWMGFSFVATILVVALTLAISFMEIDHTGLLYWSLSMIMESLFIVAFALSTSLILRSAVSSVLFCFSFYFVSRMMGFFLFILDAPHHFANFNVDGITSRLIWLISTILPRLDLYGKSEWLIYGVANDTNYQFFIGQTIVYVPLLLLMAIYDFKRKQF